MYRNIFAVTLALLLIACGERQTTPVSKALVSGVELANFDTSVRPQDDFYRYVNGNWLKTAKIPGDKAEYGPFNKLIDESEARLRSIIEESAGKPQKGRSSDEGRRPLRKFHE
jgi:putative endopeptidase